MSQPVDCLAPYSVEAFLDRRMAALSKPFLHLTQPPHQQRRGRSSPGHFASERKASELKLELICQPGQKPCEDYDAEDALAGVQFEALPWTDTDEDNCGVYEEEVVSGQLPVVLWPDTDDENGVPCLEEAELAEPATLWPDTDSEGSDIDAPSSKVQWLTWQKHIAQASAAQETMPWHQNDPTQKIAAQQEAMSWHQDDPMQQTDAPESAISWHQDDPIQQTAAPQEAMPWHQDDPMQQTAAAVLANLPMSPSPAMPPIQQPAVSDLASAPVNPSPAMPPMQQTAVADLAHAPISPSPPMPSSQRLPLPSLLTSRPRGMTKKPMSPTLPLGAQPMTCSHNVADSPKAALAVGPQPANSGQKIVESPKTTLSIAELLDTTHRSPSEISHIKPQSPSAEPTPAAGPSIAPSPVQAQQFGSFNGLFPNLAPLHQLPPPPPQHASLAMHSLVSVPPPPSHDASYSGSGLIASSPASLSPDALAEPATPIETSADEVTLMEASADEVSFDDAPQGVTTLMVRNIPTRIMQKTFMQELNKSGFRGLYDFCYLPTCFAKVEGKGFAFINFITPASAGKFVGMWHRTRRFGQQESALNISPATIQGLEANKINWGGPRIQRIRNPNLRPWILEQHQCGEDIRAPCESIYTFQ